MNVYGTTVLHMIGGTALPFRPLMGCLAPDASLATMTRRGGPGLFDERAIGRHRRRVGDLDAEIGALYARGMSSSDISRYLSAKSGVEVSEKLVLAIVWGSYDEGLITQHFSVVPKCPIQLAELWEKGIIQEGRLAAA